MEVQEENKKNTKFMLSNRDIASSVELRKGTFLDMSLKSDSWTTVVWNRLNENKFAMYSFWYTVAMIVLAFLYPLFIPLTPTSTAGVFVPQIGGSAIQYPNLAFPLGTDYIGRDIIAQLVTGAETSMIVGFGSTAILLVIGVPLGLIAGFYGGRVEEIIMRFTDFFLSLPFLVIAILAVNVLQKSPSPTISNIPVVFIILIVLGVFGWAGTTRLVDATTKQVINLDYVYAARVLGASNRRILTKHIFPNIIAPIIVIATLSVAGGILSEAGLTFLGFGSPNKDVSWGTVIENGTGVVHLHPQIALSAGFAVFFVVMAVNLFGDAIRDALDPRLKR